MVNYDFYKGCYSGGNIQPNEWPSCENRAAAQLEFFKRAYTVTAPDKDAEAMAICAMADALYMFDQIDSGTGGPVQSATIGSVSVRYGSSSATSIDASPSGRKRELYRCASLYLDIYRGVG